MKRRTVLLRGAAAIGALAAQVGVPAQTGGAAARMVIVGAGWAGLAAAQALGRQTPPLDVQVIDREPVFRSLPLSNAWLVDRTAERLPRVPLAELGSRQGWRFVGAEVLAIDRAQRSVQTRERRIGYDWLVLATGAVTDDAAWFASDARAATQARTLFPSGFAASELDRVKQRLAAFAASRGGTLVMTVPPSPYRCPPAPYERAALLGWWLRANRLDARLVLLDAGGGMPRYNRLFAERFKAQIEHRPHSTVRALDPFAQTITTDDGELRFDHALLLPPMWAGALVRDAGLEGRDAQGRPARWAAVDAATLRSPLDERVYVVGDGIGNVSPLFGAYPKTAQIAADLGAAAAAHLTAASRGETPARVALPASRCHVWLDADPPEQLQIDADFRLRGDGEIVQTVRQHDNPQPRDEDLAWARELMARRLGIAAR